MISLVANSGWYSASSSTVTIPVPSGVQSGDLLVGIVAGVAAPPPDGVTYSFYGSSGYSLQASGDSLWLLTRFASSSNPGIELPPYDLDEWGNQANTAVGIILVFRGVNADFGISATSVNYDQGPLVDSRFPTKTGNDTYSITVSVGNELGSKSINSNPYNLNELFDYLSSSPINIRAIIYGGNISNSSGSDSYVTLNISGSSGWWNTGGLAYKNYDTIYLSANINQSSNTFSGNATVVWPERYLSFGHVFNPKHQDNNTINSTAQVSTVVRYLSLDKIQGFNFISGGINTFFETRYLNSFITQQPNTLSSLVGSFSVLSLNVQQENNYINGTVSNEVGCSLYVIESDDSTYGSVSVEVGLSFNKSQDDAVLNSILNGKLLFLNYTNVGDVLQSLVTVDVKNFVGTTQENNTINSVMRHVWFPNISIGYGFGYYNVGLYGTSQSKGTSNFGYGFGYYNKGLYGKSQFSGSPAGFTTWNLKNKPSNLWIKIITREVF